MEKPKRPLSSYNLFYRYKRAKILEAHANNGGDESTDTIHQLIMAVPGLENYPAIDGESALSSPELKAHRRHVIRSALLDNLVPTQTKRSHRKSHGAMNFLEMNKIMCASWKNIDDYSLSVFEELAEEGRDIYKERMVEYNEMSPQSQKKIITSVDMPTNGGMMGIGMLGVETPPTSVPQDVASFHMKNEVVSSHQVMNGQMTSATTDVQPNAFTIDKSPTSNNKDSDRPKRPLSSYNLFYRFKRFKILESHDKGDHTSETIKQLIAAIPGLEAYPFLSTTDLEDSQLEGITSTDEMKEIRRNEIRTTLKDSLSPKTTRRTHRKPQGDMAYAEMTKLMCASWKNIDEYSRSVFEELSKESRGIYLKRMSEYEDEKSSSSSFFVSSPEPPMKKIKTSHDDTAMMLKMIQPNMFHPNFVNFSRYSSGGDGFVPRYAQGPDSPTCVATTFFGPGGVIPNMPLFAGVFEPVDDEFINNCVTNVPASGIDSASSSPMNDFPLPFMDETKKYGADKSGDATAGDFLQLIARLD